MTRHPTRPITWLLAVLLGLSTACATTSQAEGERGALVLATAQYELHVVDGKVFQVLPEKGGETYRVREIDSYDKFRDLYRVEEAEDLPATPPERGVILNGWVGLECVRKGRACGRMPERGTEHPMVKLRVEFPTRR